MKLLHKLVSKLGFALGGYEACIKYGCSKCCSNSPTQNMLFDSAKKKEKFYNISDISIQEKVELLGLDLVDDDFIMTREFIDDSGNVTYLYDDKNTFPYKKVYCDDAVIYYSKQYLKTTHFKELQLKDKQNELMFKDAYMRKVYNGLSR